jgi:hypothetical protein
MKQFKKSILLLTAIAALAAMAMPAMASATTKWGPLNTNGTLTSSDLSVYNSSMSVGWYCTSSTLGYHVRTPASSTLDVTSASFSNCSGTQGWSGCTITLTATGLPWTATATSTTDFQLNVGNVNVTVCGGGPMTWSGTLHPGSWNAATHTVAFSSAVGLALGSGGGILGYTTVNGSFRNPTQTLTLA